jgi:hypothetical protein
MERRRDAAARKEVSDDGKPSAGEAEGVGPGVGAADEESGVVAGALSDFRVSTLSDAFTGASVFGMSLVVSEGGASAIGIFSGVAAVSGEGVVEASGIVSGLLEVGSLAVLATLVALGVVLRIAGPIRSSSPLTEPLILR